MSQHNLQFCNPNLRTLQSNSTRVKIFSLFIQFIYFHGIRKSSIRNSCKLLLALWNVANRKKWKSNVYKEVKFLGHGQRFSNWIKRIERQLGSVYIIIRTMRKYIKIVFHSAQYSIAIYTYVFRIQSLNFCVLPLAV